jgi:hypothetical protein
VWRPTRKEGLRCDPQEDLQQALWGQALSQPVPFIRSTPFNFSPATRGVFSLLDRLLPA